MNFVGVGTGRKEYHMKINRNDLKTVKVGSQ